MPVCRVCQNENDIVISLALGDGAEHEANMLSQFFDPSIEYQPNYICLSCTQKLEVTFSFKKQCDEAIAAIIRENPSGASPNDSSEDECEFIEPKDEDPLQEAMHEEPYLDSDADQTKQHKCHFFKEISIPCNILHNT